MVRVALVGAGGIAREHLDILARMSDVQIVGICDIDRVRARAAAQPFQASVYSSHRLMFEELQPEAVYVCVPPYARGDIEMAAVDGDIHLFVETPVGLDLERAFVIADRIDEAQLVSSVAYQWRYSDVVEAARRHLDGRPVHLAVGSFLTGMPTVAWRRKKDLSGGQVVEQTTHLLDLARYLCGEVRRVHAVGLTGVLAQVADDCSIEDASCATLEFASGAIGTVTSAGFVETDQRTSLELYTDASTVRIADGAGRLELVEKTKLAIQDAATDPRESATHAFIHSVATGDRGGILADFRQGAHTLALALAANHAMDTGRPVLMSRFVKGTPRPREQGKRHSPRRS